METQKRWQSRTIIAALIGSICMMLKISGLIEIQNDDQQQMADVAIETITAVSTIVAIFGRLRASKQIVK